MPADLSTRREGIAYPMAVLAVAIVLVTAGGYVPSHWIPRAPDVVIRAIPHLNVLVSLGAIASVFTGWRAIRTDSVRRHRTAMLVATGLFATFLCLYLYRLAVLGGPMEFAGAPFIYRYVYLPVLVLHIGLAIVCIPLLFDALALGLTVPVDELPRTRHPTIGRIAAALWVTSFVLGILIYLLLYWIA